MNFKLRTKNFLLSSFVLNLLGVAGFCFGAAGCGNDAGITWHAIGIPHNFSSIIGKRRILLPKSYNLKGTGQKKSGKLHYQHCRISFIVSERQVSVPI